MNRASNTACCADMKKTEKRGIFPHVGETGDPSNKLIFYFQHNKKHHDD